MVKAPLNHHVSPHYAHYNMATDLSQASFPPGPTTCGPLRVQRPRRLGGVETMGKPGKIVGKPGKIIENPWENHKKPWENADFTSKTKGKPQENCDLTTKTIGKTMGKC